MAKKLPSPCIGVCKFKREGHCIACSMTKPQKSLMKKAKKPAQLQAFVELLIAQQHRMGKFTAWPLAYARKCKKKGVQPPAM
ncbi:DUF1289 domain-containing protein [Tropicimonas sp. S265A]|uniref:DUF1289 domain-containing protein n=1 Tax=Tropicimonas sp. S265A TaxID=3415134 RepID=UPI003C799A42